MANIDEVNVASGKYDKHNCKTNTKYQLWVSAQRILCRISNAGNFFPGYSKCNLNFS